MDSFYKVYEDWPLILIGCVIGLSSFALGMRFNMPHQPIRSAVYEIPMAKGQPWRVTTFQGKVYVLIEAPSMPEDIRKGTSLP